MARSVHLIQIFFLVLVSSLEVESHFLSFARGHFADALQVADDPAEADSKAVPTEKKTHHKEEHKVEKLTGKNKYPILLALHNRLEMVFAKTAELWWMDWKIYVGLALWCVVWAKWLRDGYDENNEVYYQRSLLVFGVNIMILHILEYATSIRAGMFIVCTALAAQNVFQNYLSFKTQDDDFMTPRSDEFICDTVYLDFSLPFEQIVVLFVGQCGIWWFYMSSILANFDFGHVNYLFWLWAFLSLQITMIFNRGEDSVLGNAFPVHYLYRMVRKTNNVMLQTEGAEGEKAEKFSMSQANIIARGVMGFICNSILREIMSYTTPLMLMGFTEPMDFVVYCVGVTFICTLDDMGEKKFLLTSRGGDEVVDHEHHQRDLEGEALDHHQRFHIEHRQSQHHLAR